MTDPNEMNSYSAQVRRSLSEKETEELVAIWLEDDRNEWTTEAFQAIESILIERLGALPDRNSLEEDEDEDDEIEIEYPFDRRLYRIANWSGRISWIVLGVYIVNTILRLINFFDEFFSHGIVQYREIFNGLNFIAGVAQSLAYGAFIFLSLQAVNEIIYLLIDIRDFVHPEVLTTDSSLNSETK
jgi:hypothetical protein